MFGGWIIIPVFHHIFHALKEANDRNLKSNHDRNTQRAYEQEDAKAKAELRIAIQPLETIIANAEAQLKRSETHREKVDRALLSLEKSSDST